MGRRRRKKTRKGSLNPSKPFNSASSILLLGHIGVLLRAVSRVESLTFSTVGSLLLRFRREGEQSAAAFISFQVILKCVNDSRSQT